MGIFTAHATGCSTTGAATAGSSHSCAGGFSSFGIYEGVVPGLATKPEPATISMSWRKISRPSLGGHPVITEVRYIVIS